MKHKLYLFASWAVRFSTLWLPESAAASKFRGSLYKLFLKHCGRNFQASSTARLLNLENISLGDDVYFAPNVIINATADVNIASEVMIGFNSVVVTGNYMQRNGSFRFGSVQSRPIKIGQGAWIGANCTVVAGAEIGCGVLVAANSAAKGHLDANWVYGGVPAKKIKYLG